MFVISVLAETRGSLRLPYLADQQTGEPQVPVRESLFQKDSKQRTIRKVSQDDTWSWPLTSTCTCTYMCSYTHNTWLYPIHLQITLWFDIGGPEAFLGPFSNIVLSVSQARASLFLYISQWRCRIQECWLLGWLGAWHKDRNNGEDTSVFCWEVPRNRWLLRGAKEASGYQGTLSKFGRHELIQDNPGLTAEWLMRQ